MVRGASDASFCGWVSMGVCRCVCWEGGRQTAADQAHHAIPLPALLLALAAGEQMPDAFDPSAVELMRALLAKAKPAGHLYPLAMYSYK